MNEGIPGRIDTEYYCDPGGADMSACDRRIITNAISHLKKMFQNPKQRSYSFIYLGNLDEIGHGHGWCKSRYEQELSMIDKYVGEIIDLVENNNRFDRTLVILSADHGGVEYNHGFQNDVCVHIPMFIRGPGVLEDHRFRLTVRNMDIVPTALHALGLRASPWWTGRVMTEAYGYDRFTDAKQTDEKQSRP